MDLPMRFTQPDLGRLAPGDTIPSNIDQSTISYLCEFLSVPLTVFVSNPCTTVGVKNDGASVTLDSVYVPDLADNQGWATIDTILIQLTTGSTPSGHFPVYSMGRWGLQNESWVGYDAAVCVQRYESWIVETYNTSITSPSILRLVGKGNGDTPLLPSGNIRGTPIANTRYLNTTGKGNTFSSANQHAIDWMQIDINPSAISPSNSAVGPSAPTCTTLFLTSTYSADYFSHRWH